MCIDLLAVSDGFWLWTSLGLLSVPILVALNGLFVAAEFALVAIRETRVEEMVRQGATGATSVEDAVFNLDRSIAATQLGITLASIALGWVGEPTLAHLLEPVFAALPPALNFLARHSVASGFAFLLITFLHVVFGELIPKTIALQKPDATALWVAMPLAIFTKITRPLLLAMNGTGNAILRWLGFRPATESEMAHSLEELSSLVKESGDVGVLGPTQAEVVQKAFRLSAKEVKDCMVPRERIDALERASSSETVLAGVRKSAHTRMPVYQDTLDNIVGIVNTKDLFHLFTLNGYVALAGALYPPVFVKPDNDVFAALQAFRKSRRPMAIVRAEDGKVVGLITLEDVLEEIVGDIEDEHDDPAAKKLRAEWMTKAGPRNDLRR